MYIDTKVVLQFLYEGFLFETTGFYYVYSVLDV
jgi:hypothetical protein